ncbi:MAG: rod shape-determining protein MreC [Candidatus Paceibacterota bacterium]
MKFHPRPKKNNNKGKLLLLLLVGVLLLVAFYNPPIPRALSSFTHSLGIPLWSAKNFIVEESALVIGALRPQEELMEENRDLKERVALLEFQNLTREALLNENRDLKRLLGRDDATRNRVLAIVLSRPPSTSFDTLIIDVGAEDGITEGASVFFTGELLLGEVEEVFETSSKVVLFSSSGVKTEVLLGEGQVEAVAEGRGSGNFLMLLPRDVPVKEGDVALMPHLENRFLGSVKEIHRNPTDSFQRILFRLPINPRAIRFVEVTIQ